MRTYCKGIDVTGVGFIRDALRDFLKGKQNRPEVADFLSLYEDEEALCREISSEIRERRLAVEPIQYFNRIEPISGKRRIIGRETPKHQILDYVAVHGLLPLFNAKIGFYQSASLPGKGQIFAQRAIKKWVREGQARYFVKLDIRKFYPSVDQEVLRAMLAKDVKNPDLLYLVGFLLDQFPQGINIGSYLSQYLANYYASKAYHYAQERLFKERVNKRTGEIKTKRLIDHCLMYMDDVLLMGHDKRDLKMAVRKLAKFMADVLHVSIKPWKICVIDKEPLDMVGYVFYTWKTVVRPGIFLRARRAFAKASKMRSIMLHQAYRCVSYYGYLKNADCKRFREASHIDAIMDDCKDVISLAMRERTLNESLFPHAA